MSEKCGIIKHVMGQAPFCFTGGGPEDKADYICSLTISGGISGLPVDGREMAKDGELSASTIDMMREATADFFLGDVQNALDKLIGDIDNDSRLSKSDIATMLRELRAFITYDPTTKTINISKNEPGD